jgi:hypothetical protein
VAAIYRAGWARARARANLRTVGSLGG